jgi:alkylation response protein AidB-like acyl-CoA dehydrogenase
MRDRGWFAPSWPREYGGGGGLSLRQARILDTEMARLGCRQPQYSLGVWMLGPVLVEVGTHEQSSSIWLP